MGFTECTRKLPRPEDLAKALLAAALESDIVAQEVAVCVDGEVASAHSGPVCVCHDCYSVAKAFTMTAIGMLWDEGKLDVNDRVLPLFADDIDFDPDPRWAEVTIDNVLRHQLGLGSGYLDIDVEDIFSYPSDDFLKCLFLRPLPLRPGEEFVYSDAAYYLLSRVVSKLSGEKLDDFLMRRLFYPLKFGEAAWSKCPHGYPMGATGLYLRARDMIKLIMLYQNGGALYGKRIISKRWVEFAFSRQYELKPYPDSPFVGKGGMYCQQMMMHAEQPVAVSLLALGGSGKRKFIDRCAELL